MKAPTAPDPYQTAAAQSAANSDTAITQQLLNMTNQVTPDGTLSYSQTGEATITGRMGKPTRFRRSPPQRRSRLSSNSFTIRTNKLIFAMNNIALGQIDRIGNHLSTPFNYDDAAHTAWASDLYGKLNNDSNASARSALEQRLANQGVQVGVPPMMTPCAIWTIRNKGAQ